MMLIIILLFIILLIIAYAWYANIIIRKNKVQEALGGIDVQLNQRHDLIPNILKLADRFREHEKNIFEEVTTIRSKAISTNDATVGSNVLKNHIESEVKLQAAMTRFFGIMENYPELKSDANFLHAQQAYQDIEDKIAAARRFYNSAVGSLNNSVQIFPGIILAKLAGISDLPPFYQVEEKNRKAIDVDDVIKRH